MSNCPFSCSAVAKGKPDFLWSRADDPVRASKILVRGSPGQCLGLGLAKPLASSGSGAGAVRDALKSGPWHLFPVGTIEVGGIAQGGLL